MTYISPTYSDPPTDIYPRGDKGGVCSEPAVSEGIAPLPPVLVLNPDSARTGIGPKQDTELYLRYRSVSHSLTTHSREEEGKKEKEERAAANAAVDGVGYVVRVLNTFVGVVR